jgi:hypothetical protein
MTNLKDLKFLVWDTGLFESLAVRLARDVGQVDYYVPAPGAFPKSNVYVIGRGLKGVTRVDSPWTDMDDYDTVIFTDVGDGDLQEYLRAHDKLVFGLGKAEFLEQERAEARKALAAEGLPMPETYVLNGVEELRRFLKEHPGENWWIKISTIRGDMETQEQQGKYFLTEQWLDSMAAKNRGIKFDNAEFIVEQEIPGIEIGIDTYTVDGRIPKVGMWGLEVKAHGYCGHIQTYAAMPACIKQTTEALKGFFQDFGSRGFYSTEFRLGKDRIPYLTDICSRCGSPPMEGEQEGYSNLAELIYLGAQGYDCEAVIDNNEPFICEAFIYSRWAERNPLTIDFPPEFDRWVKLRNYYVEDGKHFVLPQPSEEECVGAVVGKGKTLAEAEARMSEVAESVKGLDIEVKVDMLRKVHQTIDEAREYGVIFPTGSANKLPLVS